MRQPQWNASRIIDIRTLIQNALIAAVDSKRRCSMATLTVRGLDEYLVRKLRIRAAEHGRSAEAEHREILRQVLEGGPKPEPR